MKREQHIIARFLVAVLLLLQLGSAAAAMMTLPASSDSCHNHEAMLGQGGVHVTLAVHAGHAASPSDCDDGGCTVHCATGLITSSAVPVIAAAPFVATVPPVAYLPVSPPDRLDRPPKSISR